MSNATTSATRDEWTELADRAGDGLRVALLWSRSTGRVKVTVEHVRTGSRAELHVPPADALAAFYHPFAYRVLAPAAVVAAPAARAAAA